MAGPSDAENRSALVPPSSSQPVEVGFQGKAQENADLSKSEGVTRWLHWAASLESAGLDDMLRLSGFTRGNAIARNMLFSRWMELGPRHLFDTVTGDMRFSIPDRGEFESMLVKDWLVTDLDALVGALRVDPKRRDLRWPREQVAAKLLERNVEAGLELHREWGFVHAPQEGFNSGALEKWARADPRHAMDFTISKSSGELTKLVTGVIGKTWAQSDPEAALAFASGELEAGQYRWLMAGEALKVWAGSDLAAAADWLGEAGVGARDKLSAAFVSVWAESEPEAALQWGNEYLQGKARTEAVAAAISKLAEKNLPAAAQSVSELEPSPARAAAAKDLARKWILSELPAVVSADAKKWMIGLDRTSLGQVIDKVGHTWLQNDRDGFTEFLIRHEAVGASDQTLGLVAESMLGRNPVAMMEWIGKLPGQARTGVAWAAFSKWHRTQPEAAKAWLDSPPEAEGEKGVLVREAARRVVESAQR